LCPDYAKTLRHHPAACGACQGFFSGKGADVLGHLLRKGIVLVTVNCRVANDPNREERLLWEAIAR